MNNHRKLQTFAALLVSVVVPGQLCAQQLGQPGTLTADKLREMGTTVQFDINMVRLHPEILQNKQFLRYFVALNNCGNPQIKQTLDNELDAGKIESYYISHAAEIAGSLPPYVRFALYGVARSVHDTTATFDTLHLGEYDQQKGVFPMVFHAAWGTRKAPTPSPAANNDGFKDRHSSIGDIFHHKNETSAAAQDTSTHAAQIPAGLAFHYNRESLVRNCPAANSETGHLYGVLPGEYRIHIKPAGFDELPMNEADARTYIQTHSPTERQVSLAVYARVQDYVPGDMKTIPGQLTNITQAGFNASVVRVSVIDNKTGANLGNLMDDHSVAPDPQQASAIAPAPSVGPPVDRQIRTSVGPDPLASMPMSQAVLGINIATTTTIENETCGWSVPDQQATEMRHFLDLASRSSRWNPQVTATASTLKNRIATAGATTFCGNKFEHSLFNSNLNNLWPKVPVAALPKR